MLSSGWWYSAASASFTVAVGRSDNLVKGGTTA
jgi:hypothetical protein